MDAHEKLFCRLNDPDPHTQAMAELDLLDEIFGGNFVERWLEWNGFEDALREWRTNRCVRKRKDLRPRPALPQLPHELLGKARIGLKRIGGRSARM